MNVYYQPIHRGWTDMVLSSSVTEFTPEQVLAKWDGFIAPNGDFYGTRPTGFPEYNGVDDCHEHFAETITGTKGRKSCKDALVLDRGWISCTWAMVSGWKWIPVRDVCGPERIAEQQRETLSVVLALRGISPKELTGNVTL